MNFSSIKSKLLIIISISIIISFLILGFYNAKKEYDSQYSNIKKEEIDVARNSARYIDSFLQSKIDIVATYAQELSEKNINSENAELIKSLQVGMKAGNFADFYIGLEEHGHMLLANGYYRTPEKDNYDSRGRSWYKEALASNKPGVSAPYIDQTTKKLVVTVYAQFRKNGKLIGVIGSDIFIDTIVNTILKIQLKQTGYAYLVDQNGKILVHNNKKILNKQSILFEGIKTKKETDFNEFNENNKDLLAAYSIIPSTNWYLVAQLEKSEIYDVITSNIINQIMIYIVLLIIILVILFFTLIKLLSPLNTVENGLNFFFKYLRGEETQIKELNIKTNDEFGSMGTTIDKEMKSIEKSFNEDRLLIEEVKTVVNHINNGKLNIQVKQSTSNKALNDLKNILNEMIETIKANVNSDINPILNVLEKYSNFDFVDIINNPDGKVSKGLNNLCDIINQMLKENKLNGLNLNKNAETLLNNVDILNKSSNETAVSLEETAAAVEEITSTIANNTNRIAEMSQHSDELIESIGRGQSLANSTVTSMDEINEQTQAIAEAITVIDQIAFQTNILSLNAAVEAATAGEAGKGFAVVAQEVRNLAGRSAEAAKEIKELVESATSKTDNGKQIADEMIQGYNKLNQDIEKTTEAINDISKASKEQQISIEQINDVINRLDQETQKNASVATQTQQISLNTSKIAEEILDAVNTKKFRE